MGQEATTARVPDREGALRERSPGSGRRASRPTGTRSRSSRSGRIAARSSSWTSRVERRRSRATRNHGDSHGLRTEMKSGSRSGGRSGRSASRPAPAGRTLPRSGHAQRHLPRRTCHPDARPVARLAHGSGSRRDRGARSLLVRCLTTGRPVPGWRNAPVHGSWRRRLAAGSRQRRLLPAANRRISGGPARGRQGPGALARRKVGPLPAFMARPRSSCSCRRDRASRGRSRSARSTAGVPTSFRTGRESWSGVARPARGRASSSRTWTDATAVPSRTGSTSSGTGARSRPTGSSWRSRGLARSSCSSPSMEVSRVRSPGSSASRPRWAGARTSGSSTCLDPRSSCRAGSIGSTW